MTSLTQAELKSWLSYDPFTGIFVWVKKPNRRISIGSTAGSISTTGREVGRVYISINKKLYGAHRLAWMYMTGSNPKNQVDHINGNPSDNRFENLRDVPPVVNSQNLRKAGKLSSTGLLGAQKDSRRGGFVSAIKVKKKAIYLGSFDTAEAAHAAYVEAKRTYHKGCTI